MAFLQSILQVCPSFMAVQNPMQFLFFSMHAWVQAFDVDAAKISGEYCSRYGELAFVAFSASDMAGVYAAATSTLAHIKKMLRNMMIILNKLLKDVKSLTCVRLSQ